MLALSGLGLLMIYSATSSAGSVGMERQMIFVAAGLTVYAIISNIDYRELKHLIPIVSIVVLLGLFAGVSVRADQRSTALDTSRVLQAPACRVRQGGRDLPSGRGARPDNRGGAGQRQITWPMVSGHIHRARCPRAGPVRTRSGNDTRIRVHPLRDAVRRRGHLAPDARPCCGSGTGSSRDNPARVAGGIPTRQDQGPFDPTIDPQGIGYNIQQSRYAVGSGQLFGRGLFAEGTQTSFEYVPEQETDFIFTAVAEQLGFVGGVLVVAAFAVIIWRLLVIAANARDRFGALIADRSGGDDGLSCVRERRDDDRHHAGHRYPLPFLSGGRLVLSRDDAGPGRGQLRLASAHPGAWGEPAHLTVLRAQHVAQHLR